jgi:hypothetical protein
MLFHGGYDSAGPGLPGVSGQGLSTSGWLVGLGASFKIPKTRFAVRAEVEDYFYSVQFNDVVPGGVPIISPARTQQDVMVLVGPSLSLGP